MGGRGGEGGLEGGCYRRKISLKYFRVRGCIDYGTVEASLCDAESPLRTVVIHLKPAAFCVCFFFFPSHYQLLGNSKEECEKLDLIKIRVLNVITMEREGKKGFEGDVRQQL